MKENFFSKLLSFLILTLAISCASAPPPPKGPVDKLLLATGMDKQIMAIDDNIQAHLSAQKEKSKMSSSQFVKFEKIIEESFDSSQLLLQIRDAFEKELSSEEINSILTIYNSTLMKRVTKLESIASEPSAQQAVVKYAEGFEANPPGQRRAQLVVELDLLAMQTEIGFAIAKEMIFGIMYGINYALPKDKRMTQQALDSILDGMVPGLRKNIYNTVVISNLFTYKELSDSELADYVATHKRPEMTKMNNLFAMTIIKALSAASTKAGKRIVEEFSNEQ